MRPRRAVARWLTSGAALLGVLVLVAGCGQGSGPAGSSGAQRGAPKAKPQIMPSSKSPLRVKGTGFVPGERVRVALVDSTTRTVDADDSGSFEVTFPSDRCSSVSVEATGSKGSRASFNLSQIACVEQ
jgi:hypothetical protein